MTQEQFEAHVLRIQLDGFTVLPDALTAEECQKARGDLNRLVAEEKGLSHSSVSEFGAQIYNLMNKGQIFERLYQLPDVLHVVRHFLAHDAVMSSMQAHLIFPGAGMQSLHYDGSLTGPTRSFAPADEERRITSHVLGFNVVFCISEFSAGNGATRIVPGSHRIESNFVDKEKPVPGEKIVEAGEGSAIIFNIACWHGASPHLGTEPRYAVMSPWRRSWVRPEADMSRLVAPDVMQRAGEDARTIFGFRARAPYTDRWQWDFGEGRPKPVWKALDSDEPEVREGGRKSGRARE
ncbi:MAG: phytanoyl-CoA dioxygenase family protein [Planctomycetota bacterium]|nr:phytanoyl-CoA dioxygenase family protein [Planctomycetota bacterium]